MGTLADLTADLAARTDKQLLTLLVARPDAMTPPAATFADLASRLSSRASIEAALDTLTLTQLRALEALHAGARDLSTAAGLHELALLAAQPPLSTPDDAGTENYMPLAAVVRAVEAGSPATRFMANCPNLPSMQTQEHVPAAVLENASASAGEALLRTMTELLDLAGAGGLAALGNGALAAAAHRQLTQALGQDERHLHFHLELAAAAGLLVFDAGSRQWRVGLREPTDRPGQWLRLVQSWLRSSRPPSLVDGALARPLAPVETPRQAFTWRRHVLSALVDLPVHQDGDRMAELFSRHPRQTAALSGQLRAVWRELEVLGLTGAGAPGSLARAAAGESWEVVRGEMQRLLPPAIETFMLQGDLTAVAPGFLAPEVAATLKLMARREGRGAASIFRFSASSLEAATTAGLTGPAMLAFLRRHSSTAVPQALEFMVQEAARPASPAPASQIPAGPAPTAPASRPARPRASRTPPAWLAGQPEPGTDVVLQQAREQLALLRSGPVWSGQGTGESGPALVVEGLQQALAGSATVRLRTVNGSGDVSEIVVQPLSLLAGTLRARDPHTGKERRFSIHRIVSVTVDAVPPRTTSERQPHG